MTLCLRLPEANTCASQVNKCVFQVKVERMRAKAHDKLMNKIASVQHKAEEDRATAESRRNNHAGKTEREAEYIRRTGRIPYSISCYNWCF